MRNHYLSFLLFCCASLANTIWAHDDSIATLHIRHADEDHWLFEFMAPLHGLDKSVRASMAAKQSASSELAFSSPEYKQEVAAYVKENFMVTASGFDGDGTPVRSAWLTLGGGKMHLDDHMSTLIFEIKGMPDEVSELAFHFAYMRDNKNQHNFVRLIEGERNHRYILNYNNGFSGENSGFFGTLKTGGNL